MDLFPFQEEGAAFLETHPRAYLADEPGLGKSAQAITAAGRVDAQRILVFCPASLKTNWVREFQKFGLQDYAFRRPLTRTIISPDPGVTVVNWDIVAHPRIHQQLRNIRWDLMIGDEGQSLKERTSQRTKAVLDLEAGIYRNARRVWLLSGTPAPNHPGELYAPCRSLFPSLTGDLTYHQWLRKYCHYVDTVYGERVTGVKPAIAQLRRDLRQYLLRRKADAVLPDLPTLRSSLLYLDGPAARRAVEQQQALHEELPLLLSLADQDYLDAAALEYLDSSELATVRRLAGAAKAPLLGDLVAAELDEGLECIVLMCWHHETMDILQRRLAKYGVARVDGTTRDADAQVQKFQLPAHPTDCRVFIGQIISAGTGHTLTRAHQMVVVEPSWVPGENDQAMRRIRRIGQKSGCLVRYAALAGTIDEAIMASAERKARILAQTY